MEWGKSTRREHSYVILFASCSNAQQSMKGQNQGLLIGSVTLTEPFYSVLVAAFRSCGMALLPHMFE
jgi:hypothetical protein